MARPACEGAVYSIDLRNGKPAHYWLVLSAPSPIDGRFLAASFTDRHNLSAVTDVWPTDHDLCPGFRLAKPSVLALTYAVVKDQHWLNQHDSAFTGIATALSLRRARCNLFWFGDLLSIEARSVARFYASEWSTDCGPPPPQ